MPVNGMTVGVDYTLSHYDANTGDVIDWGDVQNVSITALKHDIKNMPYNRPPVYGYIPDGYAIQFTAVRTGSALEEFQLAANTRFNQGLVEKAGLLNETVVNPDGTVSRYQYTGFVFWVTDIGEIARDKPTMIKCVGAASDKKKIA